ncbi:MAG: hypothetical protein Q8O56_07670 [Solirubrobacteraceae bacterium]|nr:hypothetical protein [Solirubrobacteraceae bacterium]
MTTTRTLITAALIALLAFAPSAVAQTTQRAPIKDCGDVATLDDDGFSIGAVTAQRGACKNARAIASKVAKSAGCKSKGSCRQSTYTCLLAKAGKELTLVRCENATQTAFIRFEFGS